MEYGRWILTKMGPGSSGDKSKNNKEAVRECYTRMIKLRDLRWVGTILMNTRHKTHTTKLPSDLKRKRNQTFFAQTPYEFNRRKIPRNVVITGHIFSTISTWANITSAYIMRLSSPITAPYKHYRTRWPQAVDEQDSSTIFNTHKKRTSLADKSIVFETFSRKKNTLKAAEKLWIRRRGGGGWIHVLICSWDLRCCEGWKSSDNDEVSGERACASPETKHDRKASRKAVPRPPPLPTDLSELYDSVVVATERSRLSPGSLRRLGLGAAPPPPPLLPIISVPLRIRSPRRKGRRKEKGTLMVWKSESGRRRRRRKGRGLGAFFGCPARIKVDWFATSGTFAACGPHVVVIVY